MSETIKNNPNINNIYEITLDDGCFNENVKTALTYDIRKLKMKENQKRKITQKTFNFNRITRINNNIKNIILEDIKVLKLDFCNIIKIENNSFVKLENLKTLNLFHNNISTLEPNTFNGLKSLEELFLFNSNINKIEPNAFNGLEKLKILYLNNNNISTLEPNTFNGLKSLETLTLADNKITTIEPNAFNGLNSLKELYLNNNNITTIESYAFNGLSSLEKLKELYLINNNINDIESYAFNGLSSLEELIFSNTSNSTNTNIKKYTIKPYAFNNLKKCKDDYFSDLKLYMKMKTTYKFNDKLFYNKNYNVSFLSYLGLDKKQRPYYFNLDIDIWINKIDLIKKLITKSNNKVNIFRKCFVNYMNYVNNIINKSNNYKLNNKSNNYKLNNKLNNINYKKSNEYIKDYNDGVSVILKNLMKEELIDLFITACINNEDKNNLIAKIFYTILEIYSSEIDEYKYIPDPYNRKFIKIRVPNVDKYINRRQIIIDYIEKKPAITNKIKSAIKSAIKSVSI